MPRRGSRRPPCGPQRGAETLEFTAVVGLIGIVLMLGLRSLAIVQLQLRAGDDARALARDAAVCQRNRPPLTWLDVDGTAPIAGQPATSRTSEGMVAVTVTFQAQEIVPDLAATAVTPQATVVMRREPGCP